MVEKAKYITLWVIAIFAFNFSAQGQGCKDTAARFFIYKDSVTFYVNESKLTTDNYLLICGQYAKTFDGSPKYYGAFLLKTDIFGNVVWAKYHDSLNAARSYYMYYYKTLELSDKSILAFGIVENRSTGNNDILITKTDADGSTLWNRVYTSSVWTRGSGSADVFNIAMVQQDPLNGEVYLTAAHWANGRNITKLNPVNGDIIWSKIYNQPADENFDRPFGLSVKANEIVSFGRFGYKVGVYRINKANGDTIQTKFFTLTNLFDKLGFLSAEPLTVLSNGNYALAGRLYGYYSFTPATYYQAGVVQIDSNLNFVSAYCFRNNTTANDNTRLTVFPDGSGVFSMVSVMSGYTADVTYLQFRNGQILKERQKRYIGEGLPFMTGYSRLMDGKDIQVQLIGDSANNTRNRIEFLALNVTDTSSDCIGRDNNKTFIEPYQMINVPSALGTVQGDDVRASPAESFSSADISLRRQNICLQTSYCDSIRLKAVKDTICISSMLDIRTFKNINCGAQPVFSFDTTALSLQARNDTLAEFRFKKPWSGYIRADIFGCNIYDSVHVTGLPAPTGLTLGPDTSMCPNNTIKLNARSGFTRYLWQDGSTDSVFYIKRDGKYFVSATDACGNVFSDTVIVQLLTPPVFHLANNFLAKCNNENVRVSAPAGFLSYKWFPETGVDKINAKDVLLSPGITTTYTITVENPKGCFVSDSVIVKVNRSPDIILGSDTILCKGGKISLDAGAGFVTYNWSTGSVTRTVTPDQPGNYFVSATDVDGCISRDTIKIDFADIPFFSLGKDTSVCEKQQISLSTNLAGTYLWQDGATANSYKITSPGLYWLQVSRGGCSFRDSILITYHPLPTLNFPIDTTLCNSNILVLDGTQSIGNSTYRWENGTTSAVRTISSAGVFQLDVTSNGCSAQSIVHIKYLKSPYVLFKNDTTKCISEPLILDAGTQDASYLWQDFSTKSTFQVNTSGNYSCEVTNFCGTAISTIHVDEQVCLCEPIIPNVFSPNNDGINDEFKPVVNCPLSSYQLLIFDRNGQQIYQSLQSSKYWDGKISSKPAPTGAYYYILKLKGTYDTVWKERTGIVMIIR